MDSKVRNVLQSLVDLEKETGLPATVRELSAAAGYSSASGVDRYLVVLEDMGAITRTPGLSRSIRATAKGKNLLRSK